MLDPDAVLGDGVREDPRPPIDPRPLDDADDVGVQAATAVDVAAGGVAEGGGWDPPTPPPFVLLLPVVSFLLSLSFKLLLLEPVDPPPLPAG